MANNERLGQQSALSSIGQLIGNALSQSASYAANSGMLGPFVGTGNALSSSSNVLSKLLELPQVKQTLSNLNLGMMNEQQVGQWQQQQDALAKQKVEDYIAKKSRMIADKELDNRIKQNIATADTSTLANLVATNAPMEQGEGQQVGGAEPQAQATPTQQSVMPGMPVESVGMDMNKVMSSPLFKLGALLSMAGTGLRGGDPSSVMKGMMEMSAAQQKMQDYLPERERMKLEHGYRMEEISKNNEDALFKNMLTTGNKALSAETIKLVANIDSGMQQLSALTNAYAKNPDIFKTTNLSATGQQVNLMIEDLTDILGRLRSGGAINADEEKRFKNQLPKKGILSGRIEKPSTVVMKLQKMQSLFQEIKSKAEPNTGIASGIQAAMQAGASQEQIMRILKKKGGM